MNVLYNVIVHQVGHLPGVKHVLLRDLTVFLSHGEFHIFE